MRFGAWNVRILYRAAAAMELARYKLGLVDMKDARCYTRVRKSREYHIFCGKEIENQ
jgi:hypothetical protein